MEIPRLPGSTSGSANAVRILPELKSELPVDLRRVAVGRRDNDEAGCLLQRFLRHGAEERSADAFATMNGRGLDALVPTHGTIPIKEKTEIADYLGSQESTPPSPATGLLHLALTEHLGFLESPIRVHGIRRHPRLDLQLRDRLPFGVTRQFSDINLIVPTFTVGQL